MRRWWKKALLWMVMVGVAALPYGGVGVAQPATTPEASSTPARLCKDNWDYCVVELEWTVDEVADKFTEGEKTAMWAEGDLFTLVYQTTTGTDSDTDVRQVAVFGTFNESLSQVEDSAFWTVTVEVGRLNEAVISYAFLVNGQPISQNFAVEVWRGQDAPPAIRASETLKGKVTEYTVESQVLEAPREVTVYTPPDHDPAQEYPVVYMTDGSAAGVFVYTIEPWILNGVLPPLLLVGIHNAGTSEGRAAEYLPFGNTSRFDAHQIFFMQEARKWAETTLGASTDPQKRAIFGYSNGGAFVALIALAYPDRYGYSFAFSVAGSADLFRVTHNGDELSAFYLTSGTIEAPFLAITERLAQNLQRAEADVVFRPRVSGHDFQMWLEEFPRAVIWAFAQGDYAGKSYDDLLLDE